MATFTKGQQVKFDRNVVTKLASTTVSAVVPLISGLPQNYIIEYPDGWLPNVVRVSQFQLDIAKKYLFVTENELTAI
jgi:hypothetical protein